MKVIIAGGRDFHDFSYLEKCMAKANLNVTEVVSGAAKGVDTLGEQWAKKNNIPVKQFPADWNKNGNSAGPIRNKQMAEYGEVLVALWDYESRGTKNMIDTAKNNGLEVFVFRIRKKS